MNIVLLGAAGAGKGTQAAKIVEKYGLTHISTGDIFRKNVSEGTELGLKAKGYMDAGQLVPDEVVIAMVKDRLAQPDCDAGFMLDGFPRTLPQAEALDVALAEMGKALDAVVAIEVPRDVLMGRLTSRRQCRACGRIYNVMGEMPADPNVCDSCGGEVYQRDDDTEAAASKRLADYDAITSALVPYYDGKGLVHDIDGNRAVDAVWADVQKILEA
ncbi:MAG TPA: adenylate kinase [Coriobacteriia bacterium]|nr:adenylate kinase [Coriobacteriia bacterium]